MQLSNPPPGRLIATVRRDWRWSVAGMAVLILGVLHWVEWPFGPGIALIAALASLIQHTLLPPGVRIYENAVQVFTRGNTSIFFPHALDLEMRVRDRWWEPFFGVRDLKDGAPYWYGVGPFREPRAVVEAIHRARHHGPDDPGLGELAARHPEIRLVAK